MAAVACAASMSAASYTVFDIQNPGEWGGDANGFGQVVYFGEKKVTITTDKAGSSTDLVAPNSNEYAWRMYKNSSAKFVAEGITMKKVVITYDVYNDGKYCVEMSLSEGWTGTLASEVYTLESAGLAELVLTASNGQGRIKNIVVSDSDEIGTPEAPTSQEALGSVEPGGGDQPGGGDDPVLPDGVVYQNTFEESCDDWTKINDETVSDYKGWKINTNSPKCLIANSYWSGENHPADAKIQREFDLAEYTDVKLSVEQAFGYDFPTTQIENYRMYIINGENTDYPAFANFPPKPEKNWTEFIANEFDLSEYDGEKIIIGFQYKNEGGKQSRAWELKNFVLSGNKVGAVDGIEADDNAPAVYFNLQGVRVDNPENGLFIVVKGGKTNKVIL